MIKVISVKQTHFLKPYIYLESWNNHGYMEIDVIFWTLQVYNTKRWEKYLQGDSK